MKEQDREKNFEELLRQKSEGFEMKPSDDVWANVKIALTENKRRRRFLWLWAAAIGMLLGSGVFGWMLMNHHQPTALNQLPVNSTEKEKSTSSNKESSAQQTTSGSNSNEKETAEIQLPTTIASADRNEEATSLTAKSKPSHENEGALLKQSTSSGEMNNSSIISSAIADSFLTQNVIPDSSHQTEILTETKTENAASSLKPDSSMLSSAISNAVVNVSDSVAPDQLIPINPYEDYRAHRFSIEGEVIPLVSYRVLSVKSSSGSALSYASTNTPNDSLTILANKYSNPAFGYSAGANVNYRLSQKFAVGGGIHFTNMGYKISSSDTINSNYLSGGGFATNDTTSNLTGSGGTANVPANYLTYQPGPGYESVERFKWLDISAICSWIFWKQKKNELSLSGGFGVSRILQYKITGYDGQEAKSNYSFFNNNGTISEFSKYTLTSTAGLNYQRDLSTHFSISGGIQFHYYLTNVLTKDFYNTLHPYWGGVNAGIAYRF